MKNTGIFATANPSTYRSASQIHQWRKTMEPKLTFTGEGPSNAGSLSGPARPPAFHPSNLTKTRKILLRHLQRAGKYSRTVWPQLPQLPSCHNDIGSQLFSLLCPTKSNTSAFYASLNVPFTAVANYKTLFSILTKIVSAGAAMPGTANARAGMRIIRARVYAGKDSLN